MSNKVFSVLDMFQEPELELDSITFTAGASWLRMNPEVLNDDDLVIKNNVFEFSVFMKKGVFELIEYFSCANRNTHTVFRFKIALANYVSSRCEIIFVGTFNDFEITGNVCKLKFKGQYVSNGYESRSTKEYFSIIEE